MARVVLGVSGGIAAYKAVLLLRLLTKDGHDVTVVPTENALTMVGAPTFQALSHHPVHTSVFDDVTNAEHVSLGQEADLVVVAPATANVLARARAGIADDLLTATLLVATCPVVLAPAMHTEMWLHPATQENVAVLRGRGLHVLDPDSGELAGTDVGPGRLPEPEQILDHVRLVLAGAGSDAAGAPGAEVAPAADAVPVGALAGLRVAISAGGTREPLDPVRFLGNRSSGRQGIALARAAQAEGAEVTLVAANVEDALLTLPGIDVVRVETTRELEAAMTARAAHCDVLVMAAAVADFRPAEVADAKVKKNGEDGLTLRLVQNPDILRGLVEARRPGQLVVGFAAETGDGQTSALDHARAKARRKGADLLVFNRVSASEGFGDVPNRVVLLDAEGVELGSAEGSKDAVAGVIIHRIAAMREGVTAAD